MTDPEKIRSLRFHREMSQKELAFKANLSNPCTISKIETGSVKFNTMLKEKILGALEVTPEQFEKYDGSANFTFHQQQVENAGQIINASSPEEIQSLLEVHSAPFKEFIKHLQAEICFLRDLLNRTN